VIWRELVDLLLTHRVAEIGNADAGRLATDAIHALCPTDAVLLRRLANVGWLIESGVSGLTIAADRGRAVTILR
jgi:hypothetical protein